jgi:ABC-2 type transport system ATP-binding protein
MSMIHSIHDPLRPPPIDRRLAQTSPSAIEIRDLIKTYGKGDTAVRALDGVSFEVPTGSVVGLLGPNGAGKSTTVKILTTLSRADSGAALVAGIDVTADPDAVRRSIGYVSQRPGFDPTATGRENLVLQARLHGLSRRESRSRADDLLERFGILDAAGRVTGAWSGGMQRKLDVAMGLVHRPKVLFLDEPTTGLDPEARSELWAQIESLSDGDGLTVLLTTHYLDEADRLASSLVIIDQGRLVAQGTPDALKQSLNGETILVGLLDAQLAGRAAVVLGAVAGVREVSVDASTVRARVVTGSAALAPVLAALESEGFEPTAVSVARPSLDDVYLRYAGRSFAGADASHIAPTKAA